MMKHWYKTQNVPSWEQRYNIADNAPCASDQLGMYVDISVS